IAATVGCRLTLLGSHIRPENSPGLRARRLWPRWRARDGYPPQKPRRVPREQDDQAIAQWLEIDWPRISQKARRRGACLLLMDESGLLRAPLLRRTGAPGGHPPELEKSEMDALLAAPDMTTVQGHRDHALPLFLYNAGARADEAPRFG